MINITIAANDTPAAGYLFVATCSVIAPEGLSGPIALKWYSPENTALFTSGDVRIQESLGTGDVNLMLSIDPLRTYDEGLYTCIATVMSPALSAPLNTLSQYFLDVNLCK